jgi:hypothetical protein
MSLLALWAGTPPAARAAERCGLTACDLAAMSVCQIDELFGKGRVCGLPVGLGRGTILWRADGKMGKARLQGKVWKGKYFCTDGSFTNQWLGFRALSSHVAVGPSWFDEKPCVILEYPAKTPLFGNTRDELREIAPGVFLGRFSKRCPCPELEGYFVLEFGCECCGAK